MAIPGFYPNYTTIAATTATDTTFKSAAGVLGKVIVTTLGSGVANFYDGLTDEATLIFTVPASAAVGTIYSVDCPVTTGITVEGNANLPGLTVTFA